jgi:hypothetical protein
MLTKIVLAAALAIGTAGAALASNENDGGNETGGYRELGPGGVVTDGESGFPSVSARRCQPCV